MISIEQNRTIKNSVYTKKEIDEIVKLVRLELYNRGLHCESGAIKKRLEECCGINTHCHLKVLLDVYYHAMV